MHFHTDYNHFWLNLSMILNCPPSVYQHDPRLQKSIPSVSGGEPWSKDTISLMTPEIVVYQE